MDERIIVVKQSGVGTFLRGMVIGAAVALLFAPKSGKETRELLNEKGTEIRDKAYDIAQDARTRAQHVISKAQNKISIRTKDNKDQNREAIKDLKREVAILEDVNSPFHPL